MPGFKLEQFGGRLPAWNDHLLPNGQAAESLNCYLFSGALTGWRTPKLLRALNNSAARMVYRVPTVTSATATAYLVFVANVNEGDTVKIFEETYTFTATVTDAYHALLGGSAVLSAANLVAALTDAGTAGTNYGNGTVANPRVDSDTCVASVHDFGAGDKPYILVEAPDFGAAFNTTIVAESTANARVIWLSDLTSLSNTTGFYTGGLNETFDSAITGAATWLEFEDRDTNVMRSPVVDDRFQRYYFASPSLPPQYNTYDRIVAGNDPWLLGVPAPGCAPGVDVDGGGDLAQLGNPTSTSAGVSTPGGNTMFLIPITPTGAMTLNDLSFMPTTTNDATGYAAVLYDSENDLPHQLLNVSNNAVGTTAGTAATSSFLNPTGLLTNVKYWVGFIIDTATGVQYANDLAPGAVTANQVYSNGPPSFFSSTPSIGHANWQIWADLTTSSVLAARAYVYTWLTEYDEEGPPSPPTLVNGWSNGTWTLTLFTPSDDEVGVTRNITKTRIYRTVSGTGGLTSYFFVADVPVATATYVDTVLDDIIALNTIIPSTTWYPPPENLQGIHSMPNGMAVGFKGNELWFSEPYRPHAWPVAYVLTTEFPIVGIGITGQSVVACTSGTPYIATGVNPQNLTLTKTLNPEPCNSRGSILSTDRGVYYTSPNGLVLVTQDGQVTNTTELWITREKWRELTPSKTIHAILIASSYFAFGVVENGDNTFAQTGFTIELSVNDAASFTIWPQPGGHRIGFNKLSAPNNFDIYNVQVDPWTGIGILIQNSAIYYYDFADEEPVMMPYRWKSKIFQQVSKKNFEAMRVFFNVPPGTPTQNVARNISPTQSLAADQYGIVRVYADGVLVTTREIRNSGELLRIISGYKAEEWQWQFEGRVTISNMQAATSVRELARV